MSESEPDCGRHSPVLGRTHLFSEAGGVADFLDGYKFYLHIVTAVKVGNGKLCSQRHIPLIFPRCFLLFSLYPKH